MRIARPAARWWRWPACSQPASPSRRSSCLGHGEAPAPGRARSHLRRGEGTTSAPLRIAHLQHRGHPGSTRAAASDIVGVIRKGRPHVLALQEMGSPDRRARVRRALVSCRGCALPGLRAVRGGRGEHPDPVAGPTARPGRELQPSGDAGDAGRPPRCGSLGAPSEVRQHRPPAGPDHRAAPLRPEQPRGAHGADGLGAAQHAPAGRRLEMYRKHMRGLQEIVQRLRGTGAAVFVVGDLNVSYRSDRVARPRLFPYTRMHDVGMRASYEATGSAETGDPRPPQRAQSPPHRLRLLPPATGSLPVDAAHHGRLPAPTTVRSS